MKYFKNRREQHKYLVISRKYKKFDKQLDFYFGFTNKPRIRQLRKLMGYDI